MKFNSTSPTRALDVSVSYRCTDTSYFNMKKSDNNLKKKCSNTYFYRVLFDVKTTPGAASSRAASTASCERVYKLSQPSAGRLRCEQNVLVVAGSSTLTHNKTSHLDDETVMEPELDGISMPARPQRRGRQLGGFASLSLLYCLVNERWALWDWHFGMCARTTKQTTVHRTHKTIKKLNDRSSNCSKSVHALYFMFAHRSTALVLGKHVSGTPKSMYGLPTTKSGKSGAGAGHTRRFGTVVSWLGLVW